MKSASGGVGHRPQVPNNTGNTPPTSTTHKVRQTEAQHKFDTGAKSTRYQDGKVEKKGTSSS